MAGVGGPGRIAEMPGEGESVADVREAPLVLVGDDELAVRDLVCEILGDAGYRTVTAASGDEVVRLAQEHQPVLVVLDLMMPGMDGYTTMTRLRGHPLTAAVPVIVLTGQTDPVYRSLSRGVGAEAHVTKPFSAAGLAATVRQVLAGGPAPRPPVVDRP
jgi:CheY-like chemotaxis protein